jgi:hypothetical protein
MLLLANQIRNVSLNIITTADFKFILPFFLSIQYTLKGISPAFTGVYSIPPPFGNIKAAFISCPQKHFQLCCLRSG